MTKAERIQCTSEAMDAVKAQIKQALADRDFVRYDKLMIDKEGLEWCYRNEVEQLLNELTKGHKAA